MDQIHSNIIKIVQNDIHTYSQCDGLITNLPHTPLMVMVADCIPLLFFEPKKQVIGVAHAGRNGTYKNIAGNMVDMMIKHYQIDPKKLQIVLGPSIEQCCYEVSDELALIAKKSFGDDVVKNRNIDLQRINILQLIDKNVKKENITYVNKCTKCNSNKYFSYRNDKECGRFCGIIEIKLK